jgi:hypothetical protein
VNARLSDHKTRTMHARTLTPSLHIATRALPAAAEVHSLQHDAITAHAHKGPCTCGHTPSAHKCAFLYVRDFLSLSRPTRPRALDGDAPSSGVIQRDSRLPNVRGMPAPTEESQAWLAC